MTNKITQPLTAAELTGWNAAAKALAERAAGHFRNKDFSLQDECLQCASMLHDMKPASIAQARAALPAGAGAPSVKTWQERIESYPDRIAAEFVEEAKDAEIADLRTQLAAARQVGKHMFDAIATPAAPHAQAEPVTPGEIKKGDTVRLLNVEWSKGEDFAHKVGIVERINPDGMQGSVEVIFEDGSGVICVYRQLARFAAPSPQEAEQSTAPQEPAAPQADAREITEKMIDDAAVDLFAAAMKEKLDAARAKGRGGWNDPSVCPNGMLQTMLVEHVGKGDPVDVGNFAMMLWNRCERTTTPQPVPAGVQPVLYARQWELDAEKLTSRSSMLTSQTIDGDWNVPLYLAAPVAVQRAAPDGWRADFIERIVLSVAEIPDRNSPEDQPEMMLVTTEELRAIVEEAFEWADEQPAAPAVTDAARDVLADAKGGA